MFLFNKKNKENNKE